MSPRSSLPPSGIARIGSLNRTGIYALRAMIWLASIEKGRLQTAREIAQFLGVPPEFLAKVLRRLVRAGLLTAEKGHHGGFSLAVEPTEIRFFDVVSAAGVEPAFGCLCGARPGGTCDPELRGACDRFVENSRAWLCEQTLDRAARESDLLPLVAVERSS